MKYPYANPNLRIADLIKTLFSSASASEERIKKYFSDLTGKKYILVTNSCRTALYMAYQSLGIKGEVITSPLTCKVALDPIIESGNTLVFADINTGDLNIVPGDIEHRITDKTIAIQAIHLGGVACKMDRILSLAKQRNLIVIEDCAQSLGAYYNGKPSGSFGDVSCFSLIKNAYGIGGGILATNSFEIYQKALKINEELLATGLMLLLFRTIRNLAETNRNNILFRALHKSIMLVKGKKKSYGSVIQQLHQITCYEKKLAAHQLSRMTGLHNLRKNIGKKYYELLTGNNILVNYDYEVNGSSFTKFFVYNPSLDSQKALTCLNAKGIEVMHLEQRYGNPLQPRFVDKETALLQGLKNYDTVHDCLISLPLPEGIKEKHIFIIVSALKEITN
ncbi:MAG TPA: DegT/DnrJ/EryC1/StrS family aminotransferase [Bacteroidales bacterium]|nr:DegT/DnrJ/EryC1/StrS family aminotransferase [Bacteroidales bacterium]HPI85099.1 DegT/DnrJ/EryC1/StrS family aminotransferase [Bacteroidales bacterium]HPM91714.1 DegT/DnrJ/EryC1/StrS family aminotransferase [Bacteroidales bacterium]